MTKSNNEWVPDVGCIVRARVATGEYRLAEIHKVLNGHVFVLLENDPEPKVFSLVDIHPIKTEAEKRRDEAVEELFQKLYADDSNNIWTVAENIIDAGWIKPKSLTDRQIDSKAESHIGSVHFEHYSCFRDGARWARDTMGATE